MARLKQTPTRHESPPASEPRPEHRGGKAQMDRPNGAGVAAPAPALLAGGGRSPTKPDAGVVQLLIAVSGIYASFLTWAYLQEKLTTTAHGPPDAPVFFRFPVFLNTIQSVFAAATGLAYLWLSTPRGRPLPAPIPSAAMLGPLALVALTTSLASPFGYASLAHIDYITFLLAKSCKLLPVMALQVVLFRRRYPTHKYLVVAAVTAGVAVFTLHSNKARSGGGDTASPDKASASEGGRNPTWGMILLGVNLLFDGLMNTTQDWILARFRPYGGPQMMCANNVMSTAVTGAYLVLSPWLARSTVGGYLGADLVGAGEGELRAALDFMLRYPAVWRDVLGFAACGAVGQVFIFYTLSTFSSVLLVTVNVTRKMVTMIISVVAFGHTLSAMQWLGVGLVFGGIGVEAKIARDEKGAAGKGGAGKGAGRGKRGGRGRGGGAKGKAE